MTESELERFETKISPEPNTGCWLWLGGTNGKKGYGKMFIKRDEERRTIKEYAHRLSYKHWIGDIPDGLELDHLCETPICVNPDHLEPVTHQENLLRKTRTYCRRGHRWDEGNEGANGPGRRTCLTCRRERRKRDYREGRG
jgi:hypothetical protein